MYKFIICLIFLTRFYSICNACTCASTPNVYENWESASQVFIGEVIDMAASGDVYASNGVQMKLFTIRILKSYKFEFSPENNIRTFIYTGDGSCDMFFDVGHTYLIYAYTRHFMPFLSSSICTRTNLINSISDNEIKELDGLYTEFKKNVKNNSKDIPSLHETDRDDGLLIATNNRLNRENRIIIIISSIVIVILLTSLIILWRKKFVK